MRAVLRHWPIAQRAMIFVLMAWVTGAAAAASRYTVILDPPSFGADEASELTITVTGDEDATPIIPHVPGLIITLDLKGTLCHTLADAAKG